MLAASIAALLMGTLLQPSGLTELIFFIISFAIIFAVLSVVFYLAGNVVVGRSRASFKDAFAISVLGTLVLIVCLSVFSLEVAMVLSLIAWLLLVRHYYETGFLGSIAVGLTSVIVAVVILFILSILLGFSTVLFRWLPILSIF
ncbi:MAG: hypothetical protein O2V44_04005 [Candidatus Bathyarchaeota archaeon]|nr:hypothetical protein [Candidatus Bathyarchaeota archaeon]